MRGFCPNKCYQQRERLVAILGINGSKFLLGILLYFNEWSSIYKSEFLLGMLEKITIK